MGGVPNAGGGEPAVRVLLAEDHHLIREGIRALLERDPCISVVAEAATGTDAVRLAKETDPDLVIMDITMPGLSGIEATRRIKALNPAIRVLILSIHVGQDLVTESLRAGANGYVLKSSAGEELFHAIRTVMSGQMHLSPSVAGMVADGFLGRLDGPQRPRLGGLTSRQQEVLQLLAEGLTPKQIARRLTRSIKTIEMHRHNLMVKLGCDNIAQLTRYAISKGLVPLDP